ncbi:MAG: Maf family protein [Acidobacteriota bacterium]
MGTALVLASASPRRRELLGALGIPFVADSADVDETRRRGEPPATYVRRLAIEKARRVLPRHPGATVIGADTTVVLRGRILGKPRDSADARRMLGALQGASHQVFTGVAIESAALSRAFVCRSTVRFRGLTRDEIRAYVATGEPLDKAGAYAIQGIGASIVRSVQGSVTNVIGLPLAELAEALAVFGLPSGSVASGSATRRG